MGLLFYENVVHNFSFFTKHVWQQHDKNRLNGQIGLPAKVWNFNSIVIRVMPGYTVYSKRLETFQY